MAGIPDSLGLHLHDLRHAGSTWSAQSGATLKEVMARIGHSSTRAAMIYQHATKNRDQAIAAALDALIDASREAGPDEGSAA
jgi:integrase